VSPSIGKHIRLAQGAEVQRSEEARAHNLMKCAKAVSHTHIGQVQTDKIEVKNRASVEHSRKDEDHTGTPVRERELEYQCDT